MPSPDNAPDETSNSDTMIETRGNDAARFFLASIVESSQHSIITVDFDGIITTWNGGAEQIYGYRAEEAIGQKLLQLMRDDEAAKMLSNIEKVKQSQKAPDIHSFRTRKGGREIQVEVVMSPVKDDQGRVIGVSTISRDVTEQRQLEEKLQRTHEELQRAHEKLEIRTKELQKEVKQRQILEEQRTQLMHRFLSTQEEERQHLSRELHDNLSQHLAAILLHIRILENASLKVPSVHQFLEERATSIKGLNHLGGMIDELIDVTHRLAWELRPALLDNIGLNEALEQYINAWSTQGIAAEFVSNLQGNSTAMPADIETALYRVVQEALTNVKRHAHASLVSVILERHQQLVTIVVEDNGRGFDVEAAEEGNCLGIVGMRERLKLIGGTLTIESELEHGTTIYAKVPLTNDKEVQG